LNWKTGSDIPGTVRFQIILVRLQPDWSVVEDGWENAGVEGFTKAFFFSFSEVLKKF
jgi:hypothetical protein